MLESDDGDINGDDNYDGNFDGEGNLLQLGTSLASLRVWVLVGMHSYHQPPGHDDDDEYDYDDDDDFVRSQNSKDERW